VTLDMAFPQSEAHLLNAKRNPSATLALRLPFTALATEGSGLQASYKIKVFGVLESRLCNTHFYAVCKIASYSNSFFKV